MLIRSVLLTIIIAGSTPVFVTAAETLESVEAKIMDKWSNVKTMTANMTMKMSMGTPEPIESEGTIEYLYEKNHDKKRMQMSFEVENQGNKATISQTVIFDGEFAWTIREAMGRKLVAKQRPDVMEGTPGGRHTFEQLHKTNDLALLRDETVNGTKAFVIEATSKKKDDRGIKKYKFYFDKNTGMLFRTIGLDENGKPATVITFSDVKINPNIDPARFVFKGDAETKILDMTKGD